MIILGLTGSIGMGKSTAAKMLRELGVPTHESDSAVHELLAVGGAAEKAVLKAFPALTAPIDRKALGQIVFGNKAQLATLESILHPLVQTAQGQFIAAHTDKSIVALDIPLLFETGAETRINKTIVVTAPAEIQAQRVLARPNMTQQKFTAILATQMPDKEKRTRADFVVETGVGFDDTMQQLKEILIQLSDD